MRYTLLLLLDLMLAMCPAQGTTGLGYMECIHHKYEALCLGLASPLYMQGRGITMFPQLRNGEDCLKLARNSIQKFPDKLAPYRHVVTIDLSMNKISNLPDDLHLLDKLEILDVSHNRISELSSRTRFPESLRGLILAGNGLKTLPVGIRVPGLFVLDLSSNSFTEVPASFCVSDQLIRVDFTKNKLRPDLALHVGAISSCVNANGIPFCMFTDIRTMDCDCPSLRPMFSGESTFTLGLPAGAGAVIQCDKTLSDNHWKSKDLFDVNASVVQDKCSWSRLRSSPANQLGPGLASLMSVILSFIYSKN